MNKLSKKYREAEKDIKVLLDYEQIDEVTEDFKIAVIGYLINQTTGFSKLRKILPYTYSTDFIEYWRQKFIKNNLKKNWLSEIASRSEGLELVLEISLTLLWLKGEIVKGLEDDKHGVKICPLN